MAEKPGVIFDGVAGNAKAGAILQADGGAVYYLEGVDAWPKELNGKRVRVRGSQLVEETYPEPRGPNGEIAAGLSGKVVRIRDPKWEALP